MSRLYEPKSAVGRVLVAEYATFGGGSEEEEDQWLALVNSEEYGKTGQQIYDLANWKVDGANELKSAFDLLNKEADSKYFRDYPKLLSNYDKLKKAAQAAHAAWKSYSELKRFNDQVWSKVSKYYEAAKDLPPSWVGDKEVYGKMTEAHKVFLADFRKPDYIAASKSAVALGKAALAVVNAAMENSNCRDDLLKQYEKQKERLDKVEYQVSNICDAMGAAEFVSTDAGKVVTAMRLKRSQVVALIESEPKSAKNPFNELTKAISLAEEVVNPVAEKLKKAAEEREKAAEKEKKPSSPSDMKFEDMFKPIPRVPEEVVRKYQEATEVVVPKGDNNQPSIATLKQEAEEAYQLLNKSEDKTDGDPLLKKFLDAHHKLMDAVKNRDQTTRPAANLAGQRIEVLAEQGLLDALTLDEKRELLTNLRGSCAPFVEGMAPNQKLSKLGRAHLELLGAFGVDEEFRKVDRERRKKFVETVLEEPTDKVPKEPTEKKKMQEARDNWGSLSEDERLALCKKLVHAQCTVLKIADCPVEPKESSKDIAGYFYPPDRKIYINSHPESAFHYSFEAVSNTMLHETSHWWQQLQADAYNQGKIPSTIEGQPNPEYLQIQYFALNEKAAHPSAYVSSGVGGEKYKAQPWEAHAYEVGNETAQLFLDALMQ